MKSPAFQYLKATSLDHLFGVMAQYGDDARILAGGQTLLASLNMRLSEPSMLIDIRQLSELKGITVIGEQLRIGALVTHSEIEASDLVKTHAPMLSAAAPHIAHRAIRNLGTLGGSIAYADPAAEWPVCALALDANVVLLSAKGERRVKADDFFVGLYTTAANENEIVLALEFPIISSKQTHHFAELARRHGDYAVVGIALRLEADRHRIAFLGLCDRPVRAMQAEVILNGAAAEKDPLTPTLIDACAATLKHEIDPLADLTHSAETKLHLAGVLLRRGLKQQLS
jgi:aerobic carbon-monoxide dehydrogenase medium subunit